MPELLAKGARTYAFRDEVWTRARVGWLIKVEFGVIYHEVHVGRLLPYIGYTRQKPVQKATQRDEAAIEEWQTTRWPELKKSR